MTPIYYAYDPSAISPDNLVSDELHSVSDSTARIIVAVHGLFYGESVKVRSLVTGLPLELLKDYRLVELDPWITEKSGYECMAGIEMFSSSVSGDIAITYQAVGGREGYYSALVKDLNDRLAALVTRKIAWEDVLNKPTSMPAAVHTHEMLTDIDGLETLQNALEGIEEALISRRGPIFSGFDLSSKLDRLLALLTELSRELNLLAYAKQARASLTGYGMMQIASLAEALAGIDFTKAITPFTLNRVVNRSNVVSLNQKTISESYTLDDIYNGESIGALEVLDGVALHIPDSSILKINDSGDTQTPELIVTQAEAEAGVLDALRRWSPKRVAQAIDIRIKALEISITAAYTAADDALKSWINTYFATISYVNTEIQNVIASYTAADTSLWNQVVGWATANFATFSWVESYTACDIANYQDWGGYVRIPVLGTGHTFMIQWQYIGVYTGVYNQPYYLYWPYDNTIVGIIPVTGSALNADIFSVGASFSGTYAYEISEPTTGTGGYLHGTWVYALGY